MVDDDAAQGAPPQNPATRGGSAQRDPLVGTVIAERYRVVAPLGEGAMGAVYRAEHVHMQRPVALKILHGETSQNEEIVRRFEREAVAAGRIHHPNVAAALDFGRLESGDFYLALEYVPGRSLRELIEDSAPLPPERVYRIGLQIARALSAAHQLGVVHRDLKPENVMIVDGSSDDALKVLDFGLAKLGKEEDARETKLTKMGAVYGTPTYMAPEQAAGTPVDHRADLYALGCLLYELTAGHPPFDAEQVMQLLLKHMTEAPPPLPLTVPRPLAGLITDLLEKNPDRRPSTAEKVASRLDALLSRNVVTPVRQDWIDAVRHRAQGIFSARPYWILGGALAMSVLGYLAMRDGDDIADEPALDASAGPSQRKRGDGPEDPELRRVLRAARDGSDSALYALEHRSDSDRGVDEWLALAEARLLRKDVPKGIAAFERAVSADAQAGTDPTLLAILRRLVDDERFAEPVIEFVSTRLGTVGADFLFDVWAKTSLKTKATTLAWEHLEQAPKSRLSAGLRIALELRAAKDCDDYKKLLPRVEKSADLRSMTRLRELDKKTGCGATKKDDCYPCLRKDGAFKEAITQAAMRGGPLFETDDDIEFKRN